MPRPSHPWYHEKRGWWYATISGKRTGLAKGPKTTTQKAAFAEFRRLINAQGSPSLGDLRVDALCYEFMVTALRGLDAGTMHFYGRFLDRFVESLGHKMPEDVRPIDVTRWLDSYSWGNNTRHSAVAAVKRVFRWAKKQGLIQADPLEKLDKPKATRWPHTIAPGETRRIIECFEDGDPFRDFLEALWGTGCRPGELMTLKAEGVDLVGSKLTVRNKVRHKTGEPTRTVWLSPPMVDHFAVMLKKNPSGFVFRNSYGEPWVESGVGSRFRRLRKTHGFGPEATAKAFRIDYITTALERGVPVATVAELVGHRSTDMIMRIYSRLGDRVSHLKASAASAREVTRGPTGEAAGSEVGQERSTA